MKINSKKIGEVMIMEIEGRLDALTATELEDELCKYINQGETKVVFDLGELEYISSAGLRAILFCAKKLKGSDGAIAFAGITGMISEVFEISGFGTMFNIYNSALTAVEKIS
ncbi:STAS domain-containing protein [Maridesulfovibrio sp.]|jgi:anti-anti-sigma factor|uniref:STAS domain-containing protein n=1 Tax=Maridesulfovibrio sp. TaxID=2795000 RepID=UPI0029CA0D87|nr:STAS domain-containing protein [Maridesulfovibrio sp.]